MKKNIFKIVLFILTTIMSFSIMNEKVFASDGNIQIETIKKIWNDEDNKYNTRPDFIEFEVYNSVDNSLINTYKITKENNWELQIVISGISHTDVPLILKEINIPKNYSSVSTENCTKNCTITNTLETIEINGKKTWVDENNKYNKRPESIKVYAMNQDKVVAETTTDAEKEWKYAFTLPKYDAEYKEIVYTIKEETIQNYTSKVNGYDIENTYNGVLGEEDTGIHEVQPPDGNTPNPDTEDYIVIASLAIIALSIILTLYTTRLKELS